MIIIIKLIIAHLIGDFLLQPKAWVLDIDIKKIRSKKFYFHLLIHGVLVLILFWQIDYWQLALIIILIHGFLEIIKLYFQQENKKRSWFIINQVLHGLSIYLIGLLWNQPTLNLSLIEVKSNTWIYTMALIFLTSFSGELIRVLMFNWSQSLNDGQEESLNHAGMYIGMLERLFVFIFVITGNWEAIGFLLAAKSVFRFGDLKESKDRKLTEYILIGTLLSFGIAILIGVMTLKLIQIV
jgi:hypothetical protein